MSAGTGNGNRPPPPDRQQSVLAGTAATVSKPSEDIAYNIHLLGRSPGAKSGMMVLASGAVILFVGLIAMSIGQRGGGGGVFILLVVAVPLFFYFGLQFLVLGIFGGGGRNRTRDAISQGRIGMTYLLGGGIYDSYLVVDEDRRLFAIDGDVFRFEEVRQVAWKFADGKGTLVFTLRSGENPVRHARIASQDMLGAAYARVINTLGFE